MEDHDMRFSLCLFALMLVALTTWADDAKTWDGLLLQRPAGIDDAAWERIKAAHTARIQEYLNALAEMERDRPRPDADTLAACLKRRAAMEQRVAIQARATVDHLALADKLILSNYVLIWSEVSPRLTGKVRRVGRGDKKPALAEVMATVAPGDAILLEEGEYEFPGCGDWQDIAVIGRGANKTTLKRTRRAVSACQRVRFEGLTIDCDNREWCHLRESSVHMRDCRVRNYNSGAPGSAAMFATGSVLLIEGCTFEGLTGRALPHQGGKAFDFVGTNALYVRRSEFINNAAILRADFPCTFDACRSKAELVLHADGISSFGGPVWLRDNDVHLCNRECAEPFRYATDDRSFVELVLGEREELDAPARRLIQEGILARRLPYWIRLIGHRDASVRERASVRFETLTGQKVERPKEPKVTAAEVARLIQELDSSDFQTRERAKAGLLKAGEAAREALDAVVIVGKASLEQSRRVQEVLARLDESVDRHQLARDLEFARWMKWYDEHAVRLRWDEKAHRYRLKE